MPRRQTREPSAAASAAMEDYRLWIRETVDHWLEKDPVIGKTEKIVMAVGAILVGIASFLTAGAILLIVGVILLLGSALMMITMGTIDLVAKDDAPAIDNFVLNGTASVKWDDAKDFKLESACLNESMQFGGTLYPKMA